MKAPLYVLTMFLGVVLAVHLAMNGKVGSALNNARVANALFWCIGAVGAVAIGLTGWQNGAFGPLKQVHPVLLTAGILGACLVFAIAWLNRARAVRRWLTSLESYAEREIARESRRKALVRERT